MRGIVDRIEDGVASIELDTGEIIDVKTDSDAFREGDVVWIEGEDIVVDTEATEKRTKEIKDLFNSLLE